MFYPRILLVTLCTGEKRFKPENQLVAEDFTDSERLRERETELREFLYPASQLYKGMQHLRLMEGLHNLRQALDINIDLAIVSAGYGLVSEHQKIAPYGVC